MVSDSSSSAAVCVAVAGDDLTYSFGRRMNDLAKLFVDEDLIGQLKAWQREQPQPAVPHIPGGGQRGPHHQHGLAQAAGG